MIRIDELQVKNTGYPDNFLHALICYPIVMEEICLYLLKIKYE